MANNFCMLKVIWLCSWYPNNENKFRGDFIQRQAIATSAYCNLEIVHIAESNTVANTIKQVNENLREHLFYIPKKNKILFWIQWIRIHEQYIKNYILQNGKPHAVHVHVAMPSGIIAWWWKKKYKIDFLLSEHYGIYNYDVNDHIRTRSFLFQLLTKKILRNCRKLITVSNSLGNDINKMVVEKEFSVIPNVVNTNLFSYENNTNEIFTFIHVSNMVALKNVKGILQACEMLYNHNYTFQLILAGAKPIELIELLHQLKCKNAIQFYDELPYDGIASLVKKSNAGVLFSMSETQSCVILEWLCSGLPVITSKVGGAKELIDEINGYTVEAGNIEQLFVAMKNMIDNYRHFNRKEISEKAKNKYSYESVGSKINAAYKSL